jgi:capsular exopolysaccharide synthesis family protein
VHLIDYVRVIRRRWVLLAVVMLSVIGGAAVATILAPKSYSTSTTLLILPADPAAPAPIGFGAGPSTVAAFAQTPPVVAAAVEEAGLPAGTSVGVSASAPEEGAAFVNIRVSDEVPEIAQAVAEAYPAVLGPQLFDLGQLSSADAVEFRVITPPGLPSRPSSPDPVRNLGIAALVGLALGLAAVFVREALDHRVRDVDEIESEHELPVLAVVPHVDHASRVPARSHPSSSRAEAYRKVRANLLFAGPRGLPKSILVTSPNPGEGKTSLVANLAVVAQRAGQRVVIVDADLRRPMLGTYLLDEKPEVGVVDYLKGRAGLADVIVEAAPGLAIVAAGRLPSNPSELIGSTRFSTLISDLEARYDLVIVDGPPVLPVADAIQLGARVEGVVLGARAASTSRTELRRAREGLERVGASILGVVLVGAASGDDSYGYRSRSYRYGYGSKDDSREDESADALEPIVPATERRESRSTS